MKNYKKVLTIQDISCFGQCSLTVALPILSCCGIETCVLPSAVLSTHTWGFSEYTFRDLTTYLPQIKQHWQKLGLKFDCIYSGYLGNAQQVDIVKDFISTMGNTGCISVVDPVLGDYGKLYSGFDFDYVEKVKSLCMSANIIVPNITEACLLTNTPYKDVYDEHYINCILEKLISQGAQIVVLTGVSFDSDKTGVMVAQGDFRYHYIHDKINKACHGTGDIFASAFVGAYVSGQSLQRAVQIAADFTLECINQTIGDDEHWYGVKFELALPKLMKMLCE